MLRLLRFSFPFADRDLSSFFFNKSPGHALRECLFLFWCFVEYFAFNKAWVSWCWCGLVAKVGDSFKKWALVEAVTFTITVFAGCNNYWFNLWRCRSIYWLINFFNRRLGDFRYSRDFFDVIIV